jgi:hypothetical protein
VKIIFDENLAPALAKAIEALFKGEHEVTHIREKFHAGIKDVEWIESLGQEGRWIVISADLRIKSNKAEYDAFRRSKLIGFFMSKALIRSKVIKQAERILALWHNIEKLSTSVEGGAMYELPIKGHYIKQFDRKG